MKQYNKVFKSVHHKYTIGSMLGMNIHVLNRDSCSVNKILLAYTERFLDEQYKSLPSAIMRGYDYDLIIADDAWN